MQGKLQYPKRERGGLSVVDTRPMPLPADPSVLRQVHDEAQAVAVSMIGMKLGAVARELNKSEGYLSRIRSGQRPFPPKLVDEFCRVTGTLLLKQVIQRRAVEEAMAQAANPATVNAALAALLVRAA